MFAYLDKGLESPSRTAVRDAEGAWSYQELFEQTKLAAAGLLRGRVSLGGEHVGIFVQPTRQSVAALLGIMAAGGVAVPIALQAAPPEVARAIADAGLTQVIGDEAMLAKAQPGSTQPGPELRDLSRLFDAPAGVLTETEPGAPALILFTSGTTGRPKGVVHTHASLQNQVGVLRDAWRWSAEDELLHVLPLHHIHGLVNGVLGALRAGAGLTFLPRFDANAVWEEFAAGYTSVFYAVPTIYHQLLDRLAQVGEATRARWVAGAASLRLAVSGSAALPESLWRRWQEMTGQALLERYGMTEIGMAISNPCDGERRPGTVGQPLPSTDLRLVTESGIDAAPGEPGELWVRGPSLFSEYWEQPEATAESFRDGYFLTGDIATVDDGYIRILGRASIDIIKSSGYKLSALEIESVLSEHPAVSEVAVVGVPDETWGEVVTACVVLRAGESLDLAALRAWCAERLSPYKHPRRLELYDRLPRNAMGKVTKPELRDALAADPRILP